MVRIVDRRFDSKQKSAVNRGRFLRRFKGQIRKAVADAVSKRGIRDMDRGETIGIPGKDIAEPQFHHGPGGVNRRVHPGNDQFVTGDRIARPPGGGQGQGKGKASNEGEGIDEFAFTLSREEFLDIFFDDLALPNLVKTQLAQIDEYRTVRAGYTHSGVPANISVLRTLRGATGRRIAFGAPLRRKLREMESERDALKTALANAATDDRPGLAEQLEVLNKEIARTRAHLYGIPFIDSIDLRYNNRVTVPKPSTRAVMFCLMDVSGSMDEGKKQIAKRFFILLYLFLTRNYDRIDVVFIRHHTTASEVDEDAFFHSRETGGTVVSTALKLMQTIIEARYVRGSWNIYGAQASDGDNWDSDSPECRELLSSQLLPLCQFFAYVEITPGEPQNLWREYTAVQATHADRFAMRHIESVQEIYPVFRDLFAKRPT